MLLADDLVVSSAPAADNRSPKAVLDVGPSRVATSFDGSRSSDPDGRVVGYAWDFGDGSTGAGATVDHT